MKRLSQILLSLQVTEKATRLAEARKYLFRVHPSANKIEIRKAVQQIFGVRVASVRTQRYVGKRRRERTPHYGFRPDWKRAVVTLKPGEKIDLT